MGLLEYLASPTEVSFLYDLTRPVSAGVAGLDISREDIEAMVAKAAEKDPRIRDKPFKVV